MKAGSLKIAARSPITTALALACIAQAQPVFAFPGMDKAAPGTAAPAAMAPVEGGSARAAAPPSEAEAKKLLATLAPDGDATIHVVAPDGRPASGAAVSLVIFVHDAPATRLRATTDGAGVARFTKIPLGANARHTVTTPYAGVNYSEAVVFDGGARSAKATLRLAHTSEDPKSLRIARVHVIVDPNMQGIRVTEVLVLRNTSKTTYAGAPLQLPLFEGAADLEADRSSVPSLRLSGGVLHFGGYLRPGDTQLQYDYTLPLTGTFTRKTALAIEKLFVVLTKPRFKLSGSSLATVREESRKGTSFLLAEGGPIAAGGSISFEIAPPKEMLARGGPSAAGGAAPREGDAPRQGGSATEDGKPPEGMGVRGELVKDWRTVIRWLTPLFAIIIFFIVVYLAGKRDERLADTDLSGLEAERQRLLAELALATREAAAGYRGAIRKEAELTRRLADVYRMIDERVAKRLLETRPTNVTPPA